MFDYKDEHVIYLWIIKIEPYKMPKDILKTTNFKYVSAGKGIADNLKALESSGIE